MGNGKVYISTKPDITAESWCTLFIAPRSAIMKIHGGSRPMNKH